VKFDPQPRLSGDLVEVRPLTEVDFAALSAAASDPLIWEQHPHPTRYEAEEFREFFADHLASGGALLVLDRADGAVIGTTRFHGYDANASEVEIGWTFLVRSRWGGAYNGELKRLMLEHALGSVERVVLLVDPANLRSQRAVEKIGGVREGMRRGHVVYVITA
jgi:RimJ/RimL family protein N-acetyltransferase